MDDSAALEAAPERYSTLQITMHWTIAALVGAQFFVHDGVRLAFLDRVAGVEITLGGGAIYHIGAGLLIFALAAVRLVVRITQGTPDLDEEIPPFLALLAHLAHFGLYAFLFVMPVTGAIAWFGVYEPAAVLHEIGRLILIPLIAAHAFGALVEHFVMRNDTLMRMLRSG